MLLKVLNVDGSTFHGGRGRWPLPTRNADGTWRPGRWMPALRGPLEACVRGYHLCDVERLLDWIGPAIYVAEAAGEQIDAGSKVVVRRARLLRRVDGWDARTASLFAVECAERVLPLFEQAYPHDGRVRAALEVARRYADGAATDAELDGASAGARAAAWTARDAAIPRVWPVNWAAWAAVDAAESGRDVRNVAISAAWAARAAGAAGDAVGEAERAWQTRRLCALLELPAPGEDA